MTAQEKFKIGDRVEKIQLDLYAKLKIFGTVMGFYRYSDKLVFVKVDGTPKAIVYHQDWWKVRE